MRPFITEKQLELGKMATLINILKRGIIYYGI